MKYCVYQITNNVNGKVYIGAHATNDVNDNYRGSGSAILDAYKKYGAENFSKDILMEFKNADDMFAEEAEIVNEEFVANRNTYNIKLGGKGGKGSVKSAEHIANIAKAIKRKHAETDNYWPNGNETAGRKPITPNIVELVEKHGIQGAADKLGVTYQTARDRYYRMKKN